MNYGIPYMGSKAGIAASLALNFPKAEHFYDLFGGGFSITHYMMLHKKHKYQHFHYNEIKADIVELVKRAIAGEFNYDVFKPEWISRDEFEVRKERDAYIRVCWSFGNNQQNYLFAKDMEEYKRSLHQAVIFGEFNQLAQKVLHIDKWPTSFRTIKQKRLYLRQIVAKDAAKGTPEGELRQWQQLEQLERLQQLQRLERLPSPYFYSKDYREVDIKENSVVYCDIPYKDTESYGHFDHNEFFEWAASRPFPVFISEYHIADPRFKLVYSVDKRSMYNAGARKNKSEKLYWNGR
jgi:hypothetical protein